MITIANDYGVRQGLASKGVANDDIGYDEGSGYVTLKGQYFLKPGMNVEGTTFTNQNDFDKAWKTYDTNQKRQQYETQVTTPAAYVDPYKQKKDDLLTTITQIMNQTAPDPYSTPQYTAAAARAQQGAQQGIRAAQESFGSSGFGRSTALGNAAQHEQNDATQYLMTQVVPAIQQQLMNERNQKLKDQYGMFDVYDKLTNDDYKKTQDQDNRVHDALNYILDQEATQQKNDEARRASNIKSAMDLGEQYGFGVAPKDSGEELFKQVEGAPTLKARTEQRQQFQEEVAASDKLGYVTPGLAEILGIEPYSDTLSARELIADTAYKNGMLGVSQRQAASGEKNAETAAKNAATNEVNAATNKSKAELTKEKPVPIDAKESADTYNGVYDDLNSAELDATAKELGLSLKETARMLADANKEGLTDADYKKLQDYINSTF